MRQIKTISVKRQSRCNVQHAKVLEPQEVDLRGHGHGQEVLISVEVGHVVHQNYQKSQSRCNGQHAKAFQGHEYDHESQHYLLSKQGSVDQF